MSRLLAFLSSILSAGALAVDIDQGPIRVEIRGEAGQYQLFRDGLPYVVRGAGVAVHEPDAAQMMRRLKQHGGNSLRTWNVGDGEYLDLAHELGLTVALCLNVARERHGFDYDDAEAVREQTERFEQQVRKFRDHPALLAWVIGNELNYDFTNPRVYDAVNEISQMIHALDPNHPTTTTTSDINAELARVITERAPDIDFLSVQVYGALFNLEKSLARVPKDLPIMVTEWGTIGHWEAGQTRWGAPIELNSSQKAAIYWKGHEEVLKSLAGRLIGNYAFFWGQKQERTPTWYGVFVDGARTQAVDVLQHIWTGSPPPNSAPIIRQLTLDGRAAGDNIRLTSGRVYSAEVKASDPESLGMRLSWQLMEESQATETGGDLEEAPPDHSNYLGKRTGGEVELRAPERTGPYRLFVYVYDQSGAVAHANIPFLVRN